MQIYVACLASYNNGIRHGEWIDASQPDYGIQSDIETMLEASPIKDAEEWAIHDYDGMVNLGEYASIGSIVAVVELIEKYNVTVVEYALGEVGDNNIVEAADFLEEHYRGEVTTNSSSEVDALIAYYEEFCEYDPADLPEWARDNYDAILKDKAHNDIDGGAMFTEYGNGTHYVFSN